MKHENYSLLKNRLDFYLASKNTKPQFINFVENNLNDCIRLDHVCYHDALTDIALYHERLIFALDSLVIQTNSVPDSEKVNLLLSRILMYMKDDRRTSKQYLVSGDRINACIHKAKFDLLMAMYHDIRHFFSLVRHPSVFFFDHKEKMLDPNRKMSVSNHVFYTPITLHIAASRIADFFDRNIPEKQSGGRHWKT